MVNSKRKESHEIESLANLSDVLKKEVIQGYHIVQEADNIYMLQAEKEPKIHISLITYTRTLQLVYESFILHVNKHIAKIKNYILYQQLTLLQFNIFYLKHFPFHPESAAEATDAAIFGKIKPGKTSDG